MALACRVVLFGVLRGCPFPVAIVEPASSLHCLRALAAESRSFSAGLEILLGLNPFWWGLVFGCSFVRCLIAGVENSIFLDELAMTNSDLGLSTWGACFYIISEDTLRCLGLFFSQLGTFTTRKVLTVDITTTSYHLVNHESHAIALCALIVHGAICAISSCLVSSSSLLCSLAL